MGKQSFIWLVAGAIWLTCLCFGCGQKANEKKVLARVNNYVMTVEDLEDKIMHSSYTADKTANLEEALDLAIRKQVLIQEAQRQGLDRKKTFMKTIGRYWEQTLIKELLQKETQKIYQTMSKDKQDQALDDWIEGLYKKAKIKIYKHVLKELEEKK